MTQSINIDQASIVIDVVGEEPIINHVSSNITLDVFSGGVVPAAVDTSLEAASNISALRAITTNGAGKAVYASSASISDAIVIGISKNAATTGDNVLIQTSGTFTDASWNWNKGLVFLGANGTLTQTLAAAGSYLAVVAKALTPTTIIIDIETPIEMA